MSKSIKTLRVETPFFYSIAMLCTWTLFCGSAVALDEGNDECAARKVQFDGIEPLVYAKVATAPPSHLRLLEKFNPNCEMNPWKCLSKFKVEPGDYVAIAKSCGGWSLIEDISHERTSSGWIPSELLTETKPASPDDEGEPGGRRRPSSFIENPETIPILLTKGAGLSVCEAYLQRLNLTVFHEPPACGIPENDHVPQFSRLNRLPLSAGEVNSLYLRAANLLGSHYSGPLTPPPDGSTAIVAVEQSGSQIVLSVPAMTDSDAISVWRFQPRVDIANSGMFEDVIIWRDFPPTWNEPSNYARYCGETNGGSGAAGISDLAVPFILQANNKSIDEEKTLILFGIAPQIVPAVPDRSKSYWFYTPLSGDSRRGGSNDIFKFRNQYYVSTTPSTERFDQRPIQVFWWHHDKRELVCTFQSKKYAWDMED